MNTAFYDLETADLNSYHGVLLACGILPLGGRPYVITEGRKNGWNDKELTRRVRDSLEEYDILIGFNNQHFDLPFLRTRIEKWGIKPLSPKFHIDLYQLCKRAYVSQWKFQRCSLLTVCQFFKIKGAGGEEKGHLDFATWLKVKMDPKAKRELREIAEHCKADICVLPQIYDRVKHRIRGMRREF